MNWEYFTQVSFAIQVHIIVAFIALTLGIIMFVRRKGTGSHKVIGRVFAVMMFLAALSAVFIREINEGRFSWIHIFVPVTFFALFETFYYIRKGNLKGHKRAVKGLFFGALLIPGAFSFMPGRTMWMIFFA
ncbi:putative membrane protein [Litorimonas taeanensis]|uniref:Putative membrane protein n=1 Tax=Litorimonas taeanensis TaxID=568099 RepID=A0A420WEW4_9PROT|nr:DUF2306 domain-containing protein [Litorimonas taeanensis]RKQ69522.1 putative membrane protein [Litorimonas taeanensis]